MRPWMGAVAVAAAILVAPSAALARSTMTPGAAAVQAATTAPVRRLRAPRVRAWTTASTTAAATTSSSARGSTTTSSRSRARTASRTSASSTTSTNFDRIRAERSMALAKQAEIDAEHALRVNAAGARRARAPRRARVRAQRADFYENNVGRFLSIEANVDGVTYTGTNGNAYNGPTLMAEWLRRRRQPRSASGNVGDLHRHRRHPGLLPVPLRRLPDRQQGRRRADARLGQDRVHQRRRRHARTSRSGSPRIRRSLAPASRRGFVHALQRLAGRVQEDRDLAAEFPNISQVYRAARTRRCGYQRPAATMLGYVNTTPTRRTRPRRTSASTRATCPSPARRRRPRQQPAHGRDDLEGSWATSAATR